MVIPPSLSDQDSPDLIAEFLAGDISAFEKVYNSYVEKLCRYASAFVPSEDSLDIIQDVFLSVWHTRDKLKVSTSNELSQYLFRSVRNRALNQVNRGKLHRRAVTDTTAIVEACHSSSMTESDNNSLLVKVRELIAHLPPRSREVLVLRWQHGVELEDIARIMDISYGSVRVLHSRALHMLKERLSLAE